MGMYDDILVDPNLQRFSYGDKVQIKGYKYKLMGYPTALEAYKRFGEGPHRVVGTQMLAPNYSSNIQFMPGWTREIVTIQSENGETGIFFAADLEKI